MIFFHDFLKWRHNFNVTQHLFDFMPLLQHSSVRRKQLESWSKTILTMGYLLVGLTMTCRGVIDRDNLRAARSVDSLDVGGLSPGGATVRRSLGNGVDDAVDDDDYEDRARRTKQPVTRSQPGECHQLLDRIYWLGQHDTNILHSEVSILHHCFVQL